MLTQVVLQTASPMTLDIESVDPNSLIIVKSISGLFPGDITLFTGDYARSGSYYQGRRVGKRNVVFNFKLQEDYRLGIEISDVREMLYRQFLEPFEDSDAVQMLFKDTKKPDRYLIGYAEKPEGEVFTKDPSMMMSLICTDPFFKSAEVTEDSNLGWLTVPISYEGTADTGIELTLKAIANSSTITVENNAQKMVLEGNFEANDEIIINTVQGSRQISQNGSDIMAALTAESQWIALKKAGNLLRVYSETPGDGKIVATHYSYRASWWGI